MTALATGCERIRVGIAGCNGMWPHRDELIRKNVDAVKLAAEIAAMLGRRVVPDPDEARAVLGVRLVAA